MNDSCGTLNEVTAAILIGGLGTRLRSVVPDRPKVLAEIRGRPFLAFLLEQLTATGIKRVVLCSGYRGKQVQAVFGNSYGATEILYSQEASPLGTGGAIRLAINLIGSDPVLVMNGDSFMDVDLAAYLRWFLQKDLEASMVLAYVPDTSRFGRVTTDEQERILGFGEKGAHHGPGWINAGIYLLKQNFLRAIPSGRLVSIEKEIFPAWVSHGLYGYKTEGRFIDIGTPDSYAMAEAFLLNSES